MQYAEEFRTLGSLRLRGEDEPQETTAMMHKT